MQRQEDSRFQDIYIALATISATLLGFMVAALTILLTVGGRRLMKVFVGSPLYGKTLGLFHVTAIWLCVTMLMETPALRLTLNNAGRRMNVRREARAALERILSLELDIDPFYTLAAEDPVLAPLARRFRGLRPPRFASVFECLVNAVALQQLSLAAGLSLLNRLSRTYGACVSAAGHRMYAFPEPGELAVAQP
jgi:3-methyladenine DNA glycosylase/8-oxoguanine DNA glycosylase